MRWETLRDQLHIVRRSLPQIFAVTEQVVNLKRAIRIHSNRPKIEMDPPGLRVKAIEIDDDDDHVGKVVRCFAVTDQGWIICFVKAQVAVALQRQIFLADAVDAGNKVLKARP